MEHKQEMENYHKEINEHTILKRQSELKRKQQKIEKERQSIKNEELKLKQEMESEQPLKDKQAIETKLKNMETKRKLLKYKEIIQKSHVDYMTNSDGKNNLKLYKKQETTFLKILDPKYYSELLLETTHLELEDGTIMYTIEWVCDTSDKFLLDVLFHLGISDMDKEENVYLDLLWLFYITGARIVQSPEVVNFLANSKINMLSNLTLDIGENRFSMLLFCSLTGYPLGNNGKRYEESGYATSSRAESDRKYEQKIKKYYQYGKLIIRCALYFPNYDDQKFFGQLDVTVPFDNDQTFFGNSDFDAITLYDFVISYDYRVGDITEDGVVQFAYGKKTTIEILEPFIKEYHRNLTEVRDTLKEEKIPISDVENIISSHLDFSDNVEEISRDMMVFPSHVKSSGDKTNYFFWNLKDYVWIYANEKKSKDNLYTLKDKEILSLPINEERTDWKSRNDLVISSK